MLTFKKSLLEDIEDTEIEHDQVLFSTDTNELFFDIDDERYRFEDPTAAHGLSINESVISLTDKALQTLDSLNPLTRFSAAISEVDGHLYYYVNQS